MIRTPQELTRPIQEAVNRKAVVFSHILLAVTVMVHTILDPRSLGYQIGIAVFMGVFAILLVLGRFFDIASINYRPKAYLAAYYLLMFLGFAFISDAATPYISVVFILVILSNLYYGISGVRLVVIVFAFTSLVKYLFLEATTVMTSLDRLNVIATLLVFIAVCSIFVNIQKVFDWDHARLNDAFHESALEQKRLTTLINNMTEGVLVMDKSGIITLHNAAAMNLFDTNTSLIGKKPEDFITIKKDNGTAVTISDILPTSDTPINRNDIILDYGEDDTASLGVTITPLKVSYNDQANTEGFIITMRDITREKSLEQERNEFISVISHELRTPVTIMEASISNVQHVQKTKGITDEQNDKSLKIAHEQSMYLAGILNDLATFARAEREELDTDYEAIKPYELLRKLQSDYRNQAEAKGLEVIIDNTDELSGATITTNKLYAQEILQNFITNAIKYSDKGKITISADKSERGIKFAVRDQGIGISTSDKNKVFDKFFRSEDFRTRSSSGTGLGLYIVKKLAKLLQGSCSVDSELGHGSTFYLDIPDLSAKKNSQIEETTEPTSTKSELQPATNTEAV